MCNGIIRKLRFALSYLPLHIHVSVSFSCLHVPLLEKYPVGDHGYRKQTVRIRCLRKTNNIARMIPLSTILYVLKLENNITNVIVIQPCNTSDLGFNKSLSILALFFIPVPASPCSSTRALISFTWEQIHNPHHLSTLLVSHLPPSGFSVSNEVQMQQDLLSTHKCAIWNYCSICHPWGGP